MNQNKDIYLIDLGDEITWCDCPEPSDGIEKEDVTHYVRVDVLNEKQATIGKLVEALSELHAMVRGECPSLLNEDSGGDAELDCNIEDLINSVTEGE